MRFAALFALALAACADPPTGTTGADPRAPAGTLSDLLASPTTQPASPTITATCPAGTTSASGALPGSGALFLFCVPPASAWNGSVIVYAHGYVNPFDELAIVDDVIGGLKISEIVTSAGFAFATTSYRSNGLVVFEAERDLLRVVNEFQRQFGAVPGHILAAGVSEGAPVAVLAGERYPELFDGVLAVCGPIGDFRGQLDHLNDFRVLFDVFFPNVIPGTAIETPEAREDWLDGTLQPQVLGALQPNPPAAVALFTAAGITLPPGPPPAYVAEFTLRLLAYNILGTEDVQSRIGQPYDNTATVYPSPPVNNALVARFTADQSALSQLKKYETDGKLQVPVVTIHNLFDPIVPFEQEALYAAKVQAAGAGSLLTPFPTPLASPFGHCVFTLAEVQGALALLVSEVSQQALAAR